MKQFNGRYGCQLCLQEGDPLANAPMVCCWPPEPSVVLRTNEMIIADAKEVEIRRRCKFFIVSLLFAKSISFP